MMTRRAQRALRAQFEIERAFREICRPRGAHRRSGERTTHLMTVGREQCEVLVERCADCRILCAVEGLTWVE